VAVTIRDVASLAGVHISTVSRTFSAPHLVNPDTRRRVQEAATRLRYQPNRAARGLITGRTYQLALVVADIANPFFPPMIKAAQSEAARSDYAVLVADTDESPAAEQRLARALARQVDGVVLASPRTSDRLIRQLAEDTRLVLINRAVAGIPAVLMDVAAGARAATGHLLDLGHRELAYVAGPTASWVNTQIRQAVAAACRATGARFSVVGPNSPTIAGGGEAAPRLRETGATAAVVFNDLVALGLLDGLAAAGVSVPGQLSLISYDDILAAAYATPPLSTVAMPTRLAGQLAVETLLRLIDGTTSTRPRTPGAMGDSAAPAVTRTTVPTELILRGSTAPPAVRIRRAPANH